MVKFIKRLVKIGMLAGVIASAVASVKANRAAKTPIAYDNTPSPKPDNEA